MMRWCDDGIETKKQMLIINGPDTDYMLLESNRSRLMLLPVNYDDLARFTAAAERKWKINSKIAY